MSPDTAAILRLAQTVADARGRLPECTTLVAASDTADAVRAAVRHERGVFEGLAVYVSPWMPPGEWRLMQAGTTPADWLGERVQ